MVSYNPSGRTVKQTPEGFEIYRNGELASKFPCVGNFGVTGETMNKVYDQIGDLTLDGLWKFRDHLLCRSFGPVKEEIALLLEWQVLYTINKRQEAEK